ncbi:MAG: hypothetical protein V1696_03230 [Candidatus Jorgensenbacteria bacterium]
MSVGKIRILLSEPPFKTESEAVHFVVLLRKEIEKDREDRDKFGLLKFFCDWALHSKLDKSSQTLEILINFNKCLTEFDFGKGDREKLDALLIRLSSIISFEKLHDEIALFLEKHRLPRDIVNDRAIWKTFLNFLADIINDSQLRFSDSRDYRKIARIRKFKGVLAFPFFLRNSCVSGLSLEKRIEQQIDRENFEIKDVVILTIRIIMDSGSSILIPSTRLD